MICHCYYTHEARPMCFLIVVNCDFVAMTQNVVKMMNWNVCEMTVLFSVKKKRLLTSLLLLKNKV